MKLVPGLLLAGGAGLLGIGGYSLLKDDEGSGETTSTPTPETPPTRTQSPTGREEKPHATGAGTTERSSALGDSSGAGAGSAQEPREMGPYTIVPGDDGRQIVFETATKQPVGIVDEEGKIVPIPAGPLESSPAPKGVAGGDHGADQRAPTETSASGVRSPRASIDGASSGGSQQIGPYTVVRDASGTQVVLETATQQPVGVLDAQGNLVPIEATGASDRHQPLGSEAAAAAVPGATRGADLSGTPPVPGVEGPLGAATGAGLIQTKFGPVTPEQMNAIVEKIFSQILGTPVGGGGNVGGQSELPSAPTTSHVQSGAPAGAEPARFVVVDQATNQAVGVVDPQGRVVAFADASNPAVRN